MYKNSRPNWNDIDGVWSSFIAQINLFAYE